MHAGPQKSAAGRAEDPAGGARLRAKMHSRPRSLPQGAGKAFARGSALARQRRSRPRSLPRAAGKALARGSALAREREFATKAAPIQWPACRGPARPHDRRMRIDIWSDVVCPWCWIGKRRFQRGLELLGAEAPQLEVHWHPFLLDPDAGTEPVPLRQAYARKFGGPERTAQMLASTQATARAVGLP